ncbi:hypothetical protein FSC37_13100 [Piscinibacter aquaticus]|uniref:Acyltransferase 3 domain-containing protein n=1 Tax=Piscinibacter aquaticus TaxID=392597 RepID=A0A5C6U3W7_9BURK|nr:hypothetical protein FSC37_13100 [Piscinibacter aquaticus]
MTAALFALFVIGVANSELRFGARSEALVRWLAGYTFTLYLVHFPILVFCTALGLHRVDWLTFCWVTAATLAATGCWVRWARCGARSTCGRSVRCWMPPWRCAGAAAVLPEIHEGAA